MLRAFFRNLDGGEIVLLIISSGQHNLPEETYVKSTGFQTARRASSA